MEASDYCIISTTTDSKENADTITQLLLEKKLVACIQSSIIQSAYSWQKKIIHSEEILLQMKTKRSLFEKVRTEIEHLHTYDVPEIIMVPIDRCKSTLSSMDRRGNNKDLISLIVRDHRCFLNSMFVYHKAYHCTFTLCIYTISSRHPMHVL